MSHVAEVQFRVAGFSIPRFTIFGSAIRALSLFQAALTLASRADAGERLTYSDLRDVGLIE